MKTVFSLITVFFVIALAATYLVARPQLSVGVTSSHAGTFLNFLRTLAGKNGHEAGTGGEEGLEFGMENVTPCDFPNCLSGGNPDDPGPQDPHNGDENPGPGPGDGSQGPGTISCEPEQQNYDYAHRGQSFTFTASGYSDVGNIRWQSDEGAYQSATETFTTSFRTFTDHRVQVFDGFDNTVATCHVDAYIPSSSSLSCSAAPVTVRVNEQVVFTATGGQGIHQWSGQTGTTAAHFGRSITTTYAQPDTYSVHVETHPVDSNEVTGSADCSVVVQGQTQSGDLDVSVNASPDSGNAPLTSAITVEVHGNTQDRAIDYSTDCGNGTIKTQQTQNKSLTRNCTYSSADTYTVSATAAVPALGKEGSDSTTVTVTPSTGGNPPPSGGAPTCDLDFMEHDTDGDGFLEGGERVTFGWGFTNANRIDMVCPWGTASETDNGNIDVDVPAGYEGTWTCTGTAVNTQSNRTAFCSDSVTVYSSGGPGQNQPSCFIDFSGKVVNANGTCDIGYQFGIDGASGGTATCNTNSAHVGDQGSDSFIDLPQGSYTCSIDIDGTPSGADCAASFACP